MAKTIYTERDIEALADQGVLALEVGQDVILTDLARDKARRLGVELVERRPAKTVPTRTTAQPDQSSVPAQRYRHPAELENRIFDSVKARLGDQVDDALLRTIVKRVIKSLGGDNR